MTKNIEKCTGDCAYGQNSTVVDENGHEFQVLHRHENETPEQFKARIEEYETAEAVKREGSAFGTLKSGAADTADEDVADSAEQDQPEKETDVEEAPKRKQLKDMTPEEIIARVPDTKPKEFRGSFKQRGASVDQVVGQWEKEASDDFVLEHIRSAPENMKEAVERDQWVRDGCPDSKGRPDHKTRAGETIDAVKTEMDSLQVAKYIAKQRGLTGNDDENSADRSTVTAEKKPAPKRKLSKKDAEDRETFKSMPEDWQNEILENKYSKVAEDMPVPDKVRTRALRAAEALEPDVDTDWSPVGERTTAIQPETLQYMSSDINEANELVNMSEEDLSAEYKKLDALHRKTRRAGHRMREDEEVPALKKLGYSDEDIEYYKKKSEYNDRKKEMIAELTRSSYEAAGFENKEQFESRFEKIKKEDRRRTTREAPKWEPQQFNDFRSNVLQNNRTITGKLYNDWFERDQGGLQVEGAEKFNKEPVVEPRHGNEHAELRAKDEAKLQERQHTINSLLTQLNENGSAVVKPERGGGKGYKVAGSDKNKLQLAMFKEWLKEEEREQERRRQSQERNVDVWG
ncbi:hypothetical protein [Nesterenkonia alba]|uniref:hypothetical protein n=1 Tax=Nesterenkonia alba TaxID=515814 RepID=UPI0003B2F63B|nr:hypothetical protein [Nesterenkonia alba]